MKKTILVVEDEQSLMSAVKAKLATEGYATVGAKSVDVAIQLLEKNNEIAAVWLDHYLLGDKNGIDLVNYMKKDGSAFKSIPVFIVSNTASQDKVHSYMAFGAQKYYTKSDHKLSEIIADITSILESDE